MLDDQLRRPALVLAFACAASWTHASELALWATGDCVKVAPECPAEARNYHWDGANRRVTVAGARGEVVAFQIVLQAKGGGLDGVNVGLSDFKSRRHVIPRRNVVLFRELYVRLSPDAQYMARRWFKEAEYPDALIPFHDPYDPGRKSVSAPFNISPGKNQPVWVDVGIPRDAPPGTYEARLVATARGAKPVEATVRLVVWDFGLPKDWKLDAAMDFYWTSFTRGEGLPGGSGFSEKKGLVAKRYDVMAFRHGFFNMHWWPTPQTAYDGEGHLTKADWSAYDRYFGDILSGRLLGVVPSIWKMPVPEYRFYKPKHLSDPKAVATAYWEYSREMARHFHQKGWEVPLKYVYTIDEPGNWYKGSKESIIRIADAIRRGSEDKFRVFIPADTTIGAGHVNFWAIYPSQYHVSKMQARQKAGDVVWFYQGCHEWQGLPVVYIPDYALAMRLWPWIAWKYDVGGIFHWACNNWGQNPYTENTAADDPRWGPGNGKFFYPGRPLSQIGMPSIEGPVSCIRMKMWRRGMQDYQYFWMLKEKGQGALADSVVNRLVRKALAEGELDWNKELVQGGWCTWEGNWSKKPNDYYGARTELARSLSVLYGGRLKKRFPSVRSKAVTPRPGHEGGAAEAKERPVPRELSQMYRMARSMMSVGQKDAAAAMFRKIVEKYPDSLHAEKAREYLKKLERPSPGR